MLRVHTADGRTTAVDLSDEQQARDWLARLSRTDVARTVTGITLANAHLAQGKCPSCGARASQPLGIQFSITRPQDFGAVSFAAGRVEPEGRIRGGERVLVFADDVRLSVMAHAEQPAVRVALSKVGKLRFNPNTRYIQHDADGE